MQCPLNRYIPHSRREEDYYREKKIVSSIIILLSVQGSADNVCVLAEKQGSVVTLSKCLKRDWES